MSLKQTVKKGVLWTFLQSFSGQLISFGITIFLSRLLVPSDVGLVGMVTVVFSVSAILIDMGMEASLLRTEHPTEKDYNTIYLYNVFVSFLLYGLIFLLAPLIAAYYKNDQLIALTRVTALTMIFTALGNIRKTRYDKEMNFKPAILCSLSASLLSGVLGVFFAYKGYGVWSIVYMYLGNTALCTIFLWLSSKWRPQLRFDKQTFRHHFNFGYKVGLQTFILSFFKEIYVLIIGRVYTPGDVGLYYRAQSLMMLPAFAIGSVVNRIALPLFAQLNHDNEQLRSVYVKIMKLVAFVLAPIVFFMAGLATPLITFLFGAQWLASAIYFRIIALTGVLYAVNMYNYYIMGVKGRSDLSLKVEAIKKLITIVILFFAIQKSMVVLLYASVIISVIEFFINAHFSGKLINYSALKQARDVFPTIFIAATIGYGLYFFDYWLNTSINIHLPLFRLLIGGIVGLLLYLIVCKLYRKSGLYELLDFLKKQ